MLLAVNIYNGSDKMSIWDTDDMVVEEVDKEYTWSKHGDGTIKIANFQPVHHWDGVVKYSVNHAFLVPFEEPVVLGCGDIWYGRKVWNALSERVFEIQDEIRDIVVSGRHYCFKYRLNFDDSPTDGALFLYKSTGGLCSNVMGDIGVKMSRSEFMRKVLLGGA